MGIDQVNLSEEQREILEYTGEELLIRGVAGSGKTLLLFRKAELLARKNPDKKIGIITYNSTLANSIKVLHESLGIDNIEASTFHSWAMRACREIMKIRFLRMKTYRSTFLQDALEKMKSENHRFIKDQKKYKGFLEEEISWIKGKGIVSLAEYEQTNRTGRGSEIRVTQEDRKLIYRILEGYEKEKGRCFDFDDLGLFLYQNIDRIPDKFKYDYLFIDEAQDLQQIQLYVLRKIAKESIIIAADKGQKIYKTSFTWRDVGINVTGGRTKLLRESFRSTKQIIQLAKGLQKNDSIKGDDEFIESNLPEREGPLPLIVGCQSKENQDRKIINMIKNLNEKHPQFTIGLLSKHKSGLFRIKKHLSNERIPFEEISNKRKEANPYSPGVKLCTIHSSKGLGFDVVILFNVIETRQDRENEANEEYWDYERRLLYVGLTRAKSLIRMYYYGTPNKLLSELDEELYHKEVL